MAGNMNYTLSIINGLLDNVFNRKFNHRVSRNVSSTEDADMSGINLYTIKLGGELNLVDQGPENFSASVIVESGGTMVNHLPSNSPIEYYTNNSDTDEIIDIYWNGSSFKISVNDNPKIVFGVGSQSVVNDAPILLKPELIIDKSLGLFELNTTTNKAIISAAFDPGGDYNPILRLTGYISSIPTITGDPVNANQKLYVNYDGLVKKYKALIEVIEGGTEEYTISFDLLTGNKIDITDIIQFSGQGFSCGSSSTTVYGRVIIELMGWELK